MSSINELYDTVRKKLLSFCVQLTQETNKFEELKGKTEADISSLDTGLRDALKTNEEQIADVTAFYNIAKGHSSLQFEKPQETPYDKTKLLQLNVQINTRNSNDPFAAKLLVEAGGQLLYLNSNASRIRAKYEGCRQNFLKDFNVAQNRYMLVVKAVREECLKYLNSPSYQTFVEALYSEYCAYNTHNAVQNSNYLLEKRIGIGVVRIHFPTPNGCAEYIQNASRGFYNSKDGTIALPISLSVDAGTSLFIEYNNKLESSMLLGIQNYLANIVSYYGDSYSQIIFIDPVRYNNASLGVLSVLAEGKKAIFDNVPNSPQEIAQKLESLIREITLFEKQTSSNAQTRLNKIIVLHNFPQGYDSSAIKQVQQICVNAARYNFSIIMTHNTSEKVFGSEEAVSYIKSHSSCIYSNDDEFRFANSYGQDNLSFLWYLMPNKLPDFLKSKYIDNKPIVDFGNDFEKRIGLSMRNKPKGTRLLTDIPYGVNENGEILSLSFEQDNFSTFICGAAGSGKSTLLHTIITGLIENNHPDDIELWLIDYKMVEFSKYVEHKPPHVRYVILDQSPELVYDIIDRLTEIMIKRQNIFKGKWNELKDVPPDKYMPAIMVIIDEFPVMSQAIADSINYTENYMDKLDLLLSKGRGLGIHFIFASQNYTSGIKGLSNFAKMQTQQRIAMKTDRNEIRETLSLSSPTDKETALMEHLSVTKYYALTRFIPEEDEIIISDSRLVSSKVINIANKSEHARFLDSLSNIYTPLSKYDVSNDAAFIDKKTLVLDGNTYLSFDQELPDMKKIYDKDEIDEGDSLLFLGQPLRMQRHIPVALTKSFGENILIIAPQKETAPAISVLLSIEKSLKFSGKSVEIWSSTKSPVLKQLIRTQHKNSFSCYKGTEEVCKRLGHIKELVERGVDVNKCICLMGFESIVAEMSFQDTSSSASHNNRESSVQFAKREVGEMDLISQMEAGFSAAEETISSSEKIIQSDSPVSFLDICSELKNLLANAPKYGCNFIMIFNSLGEFNQCKVDAAYFRHKILFRIPRNDSMMVVGSHIAKLVEGLSDRSFRYSDGLDTLAFRPYLHDDLSWDGWHIESGIVVNEIDEDDEYLQ